ncbi:putative epoxide hydrolase [Stagonosporopsis vannaccii]|nr:putative epoxide hydrolase [Stagonosporopsis vannaccii]
MTSTKPFSNVPPGASQQPRAFELHVNEQKLQDFKTLLKLSPIAKETYENLRNDGEFGVTHKWMSHSKEYWQNNFDWRKEEDRINVLPNFKTQIKDDDSRTYDVHFAALFSSKSDAIPIAFLHGWPGSFLEFVPLMQFLKEKYTPDTLPYHIIAPSHLGYALSSDPPQDQDWTTIDAARIIHRLMLSLGFGSRGYLVQGGDIGALIGRVVAARYDECKGMHLNFMLNAGIEDKAGDGDKITEQEEKGLKRKEEFFTKGRAYAHEHATKPATIGFAMASSPVAQLAWIGEKFLAWSDPSTTPSINTILTDITLYWLTDCFPTTIYTYREEKKLEHVNKPSGYSYFPYELAPIPQAWAAKTCDLVFFRSHQNGGHFAALERPETLWEDVEEYVKIAWK